MAGEVDRTAGRMLGRRPESAYWLLEKSEGDSMEALTVDLRDAHRALAVFSHPDEAEMFLWLGGLTSRWRARKHGTRELASVLAGPCAGVRYVALDPLPEMVVERTVALVVLAREHFASRFMGDSRLRGDPRASRVPPGGSWHPGLL
jgi:hypothetical protein